MTMNHSLLSITECSGIFVDACLCDDQNQLLFLSLWGRDTAVLELFSRITLGGSDANGLSRLRLKPCDALPSDPCHYDLRISDPSVLTKAVAKTPKHTVFGSLANVWIYDEGLVNGTQYDTCWIVSTTVHSLLDIIDSEDMWSMVKRVSEVPLLDTWRQPVMRLLVENQWLTHQPGFAVNGVHLSIEQSAFTLMISELVACRQLQLTT